MDLHRRLVLTRVVLAGLVSQLIGANANAETVNYSYDAQGRLTRATYSNGVIIDYTYDAAGNRAQVVRSGGLPGPPPPPPPGFSATISVTSGGANLRSLANAAGYNGATDATVTFNVPNSAVVTGAAGAVGAAGGVAIDSGDWPTGLTIALTLVVQTGGIVRGGGGGGGGGSQGTGAAGGAGGDAIYLRTNFTGGITIQSGAEVSAGGGGGGGGGGARQNISGEVFRGGGGGGGGGYPNGSGAPGGLDGGLGPGDPGAPGTTSGGGLGGGGAGGAGGNGGNVAANGTAGGASFNPGGALGVAGFAVRKNGFAATVSNSGTLNGTVT